VAPIAVNGYVNQCCAKRGDTRPLSPATICQRLAAIRWMFRVARDAGLIHWICVFAVRTSSHTATCVARNLMVFEPSVRPLGNRAA